jgi:hypothetical protein
MGIAGMGILDRWLLYLMDKFQNRYSPVYIMRSDEDAFFNLRVEVLSLLTFEILHFLQELYPF